MCYDTQFKFDLHGDVKLIYRPYSIVVSIYIVISITYIAYNGQLQHELVYLIIGERLNLFKTCLTCSYLGSR